MSSDNGNTATTNGSATINNSFAHQSSAFNNSSATNFSSSISSSQSILSSGNSSSSSHENADSIHGAWIGWGHSQVLNFNSDSTFSMLGDNDVCALFGTFTLHTTTITLHNETLICDEIEDSLTIDYRIITHGGLETLQISFDSYQTSPLHFLRHGTQPPPSKMNSLTGNPNQWITDSLTLIQNALEITYEVEPGTTLFVMLQDRDYLETNVNAEISMWRPDGSSYTQWGIKDVVNTPMTIEALDSQVIIIIEPTTYLYNTGQFMVWLGNQAPPSP